MSRGKKIDIFIGANIDDNWTEIQEKKETKISNKLQEAKEHFLSFKREKRRGKIITLVGEFNITKENADSILKNIKKKLGCGGSYKNSWMEFQGEVRDKLNKLLKEQGFRFKNS